MKRVALFLMTNLAIVVVLGASLMLIQSLFGVNLQMGGQDLNLGGLMIVALVIGFGGAFLSLLISKPMAKWSTRARVITQPSTPTEHWLLETVRRHAQRAGIQTPEVAIYEGAPNAFATGAFKNSALVAVSTGLLNAMNQDEVEAVVGHEIAHVANGDMVTLALIQGVMNTFVVFLSRVLGYFIDRVVLRNQNDAPGAGYYLSVIVLDIVLGFLAAMVVAWFSRQREFRADAGSAAILGSSRPMINALTRLGNLTPGELPQQVKTMGINAQPNGLLALFSSHPPIEQRIRALQTAQH